MSSRFSMASPFGVVDSPERARSMARLTSLAFALSAGISLIQAGAVWYGSNASYEAYRGGTAGFALLLAVVAAGLALVQWRRPNRILPVFGLAWSLYELSAFLTAAVVGAPLGPDGIPAWSPYISVAGMAACLILHIGGLRGAAGLARLPIRS